MTECNEKCETYSRIVGYFRPVQNWNIGKKEEFKDRIAFNEQKTRLSSFKSEKCDC